MGRKQTARQVLTELPLPTDAQLVGKVLETRGGGVYDVVYYDKLGNEQKTLISLPTKFRKLIWVKRGSYIIFELLDAKTKIEGEIVHVLFPEHIKNLRNQGLWPSHFDTSSDEDPSSTKPDEAEQSGSEHSTDDDDLLMANPNHQAFTDDEEDD
ncbi:putative RNA-binding protein eif1ad [Rhizophlyctis rosea]|uniref:RNA-binding protein eif1ad n=1 Tax=Rhizophlyctis rosea TaxID=64517 RepID=A0AAD5SCZ2_9FUNG|nr:putative RNA-binding protein eif1ad [Rhizophlyctis rosea]